MLYGWYMPRHNDGLNVAFVDGHAKWMKPQTMLAGLDTSVIGGSKPITDAAACIWDRQ